MRILAVRLVLAAVLCLGPGPLAARPYALDDLLRHEDIGQVLVDPGGRWLAFEKLDGLVALARPDRIALSHVLRARPYLVDLRDHGRARALLPGTMPPGSIILGFSPKGTQLAIARLEDARFRLGLVTLATGTVAWFPYAPSHDGFHAIVAWLSEDRLVLLAEAEADAPWRLAMDLAPDRVRARWDATASGARAVTAIGSGRYLSDTDRPRQRLLLLDRRSGNARELAKGHFNQLLLSPRGTEVALLGLASPRQPSAQAAVREDDGYFVRSLLLVDLRSGERWAPCPRCAIRGDPRWGAAGRQVAFLVEDKDRLTAMVADMPTHHARRVDPGVPAAQACALGPDEGVPVQARSSRPSGSAPVAFAVDIRCVEDRTAPAPGWTAVAWRGIPRGARIDLAGLGTIALPGFADGAVASVETLQAGKRAVLLRLRAVSGETRLMLADRDGVHDVLALDAHMRGIVPARMQRLDQGPREGAALAGWLFLPPGRAYARGLPLVVIPYPGQMFAAAPPADQMVSGMRPYANAQLLAAAGFAVLMPSFPMPDRLPDTGFAFARALAPAIDAALATGCCDASRIALWGHSYGAYAVAMAATQDSRYRAIVASAGIYDLSATVGTFGPSARIAPEHGIWIASAYAWAEAGQGRMGDPPWKATMRYVANSPVYRADRVTAPMLLIAADRDFSPPGQAEQMFSALFRQGKDAQLLTYWGEGHVIASPANLADMYRRVIAFLEENLLAPSPPGHDAP